MRPSFFIWEFAGYSFRSKRSSPHAEESSTKKEMRCANRETTENSSIIRAANDPITPKTQAEDVLPFGDAEIELRRCKAKIGQHAAARPQDAFRLAKRMHRAEAITRCAAPTEAERRELVDALLGARDAKNEARSLVAGVPNVI
jgi:hypothetical protein